LAQNEFERATAESGRAALDYAKKNNAPTVAMCGTRHVIHDRAINFGIADILRQNGAMVIPMDAYPVAKKAPEMLKINWADVNRYMRAAFTAKNTGNAYPLMLGSIGCGPDSLVPLFYFYDDGTPHNTRKADSFAYRLHKNPKIETAPL
jgi:predicted nucleotide-binding protein (sugar kinase/HSP70/actin superfamily)